MKAGVWRRVVRRLIWTSRHSRSQHSLGRLLGRRAGISMEFGVRVAIWEPDEWIQRHILWEGGYELHLLRLIASCVGPGDCFLDVGANIGQHALVAASCGATVHAFEPVPRLAEHLQCNVRLNRFQHRITVNSCALSASRSSGARLFVRSRADDGSHSMLSDGNEENQTSIAVTTTTVDLYVRERRIEPALIKIDVEGAEAFVLDGAAETLARPSPPVIFLETGDRLASSIGEGAESVLMRLFRSGYEVFKVNEDPFKITRVRQEGIDGTLSDYLALHPGCRRHVEIASRHGLCLQHGALV
jgi:FkbM family methyltransferase